MQLLVIGVTLCAVFDMSVPFPSRRMASFVTTRIHLPYNGPRFESSHTTLLSPVKLQVYNSCYGDPGDLQHESNFKSARHRGGLRRMLLLFVGAMSAVLVVSGSVLVGLVLFGRP
jgi:hypothetical protein